MPSETVLGARIVVAFDALEQLAGNIRQPAVVHLLRQIPMSSIGPGFDPRPLRSIWIHGELLKLGIEIGQTSVAK